jgi:hypothetical protein
MSALSTIAKGIPAVEVINLFGMVLNHAQTMAQIKNDYLIKSKQLDYEYQIAKQSLDNDMKKFEMAVSVYMHSIEDRTTYLNMASSFMDKLLLHVDDAETYTRIESTLLSFLDKHTQAMTIALPAQEVLMLNMQRGGQ